LWGYGKCIQNFGDEAVSRATWTIEKERMAYNMKMDLWEMGRDKSDSIETRL
jgi:hypothetical protein